jgi:MFS family permease
MAGLVIKFLVDRIGAKPIFIVCVIIGLLSMIPILFFPALQGDNFTTVTLYLAFLFFVMNFGWLGTEGVMQTYFLGLIPAEKIMDMGILYFFGFGIAGAGGSLLSGVLLDAATAISGSPAVSFKILYAILIAVSVAILVLMRKLVPLGALPFWGALEVMFSFRDLKAISLLEKLNKTSSSGEEEAILEALQDTPSQLAVKGLLTRIKSPRLAVRVESIRAINALSILSDDAEQPLIDDILNNPYTTAYMSARTLGNHGVFRAAALLRELAMSSDYMLAGEAIIALAKIGDNAFRPQVEHIVSETQNPRLKIMGAEALGIYASPDSLPVLLDIVKGADPPPYLRDEVVLAMSNILDIQNQFYPLLVRFLADESHASTLALDKAESAYEHYASAFGRKRPRTAVAEHSKDPRIAALSRQAKAFQAAASDYIRNSSGAELSRWIRELPDELIHDPFSAILSEAVLDPELMDHPRLQLLIVSWAAHELRLWTNKLKREH